MSPPINALKKEEIARAARRELKRSRFSLRKAISDHGSVVASLTAPRRHVIMDDRETERRFRATGTEPTSRATPRIVKGGRS